MIYLRLIHHQNIGIGNHIYQQKEYLKKTYYPDMDLEHFLLEIISLVSNTETEPRP
jgi:hypothetical protein